MKYIEFEIISKKDKNVKIREFVDIDHASNKVYNTESQQKQELLKQLKNNKSSCLIKTHLLRESLIIPLGPQETRNYKNKRHDVVYKFNTAFKHISNITWEEVQINRPKTVITEKGVFRTNKITRKIQNIKECYK